MLLLSTSRYNNSHWDVVKTDSLKPLELKKAPSIPSGMETRNNFYPLLDLVLGIDELNHLHDLQNKSCKELIKSIGGIMCKPPANIYFIPILAGTIKEPIKNYTSGSMHEPLFLPLRLLNDSDSINIGKNMKLFDDDVHPYF
ncbi:hypothetical protein RhiirA1_460298 [Rhizophagus irregularis]|uniref:Uncharacterized protein n=1 Tax=Rhizophagus irregularis TaxID=588596 RepID=A0A2N0RRS5_9GLOM|nr:hypothetical protein RhiirA1_460298 [Rhizophagus irregularis]